MTDFNMTYEGMIRHQAKIEEQDGVATRSDQAFLVLAAIRMLCSATESREDSYKKGEEVVVDVPHIRAMMLASCGAVDEDFAEILNTMASLSFESDLHAAITRVGCRAASKRSRAQSTKTYFLKNKDTGLLKIGRSYNPEARAKALQCGAGVELDILLVIDEDIERELHLRFSDDRAFNEWFYHSDAIDSYIKDKLIES